ncbi:SGNH/GDSL hydrolase family protein [Actibacterium sp. 188UL27-1]|uniref:SGNH/GDSL hydrolase family protein n=1 Tax=Actibacterium sp. 188UL27-1 TaxID=2786961 RepID=UPI001958D75E|nr:SGNH/GDSL hydrolase family protein [Actibacterium sp. 188UL27-1]MBM7069700.1 SGNH/GDSL hydrolase family protein [Actibacterium sp. 188UL27-1]
MRILSLAAVFSALAQLAVAAPIDPPWTDLVVFGDSLSDQGNTGPGAVATNGKTWAEVLGADPARTGGANYAVLGATAANDSNRIDFQDQLTAFRAAPPDLGDDPLVVVWLGGNDLLKAGDIAAVSGAVDAIKTGIGQLASEFGLNRFAIAGLPDLGLIPRFSTSPKGPGATAASDAFNAALNSYAQSGGPGLDLSYVDIQGLFDGIQTDPGTFGFSDVTGTCDRGAMPCDGVLFWDDIHPTAAAHALVADSILAAVSPAPATVPLPASLWLMLGGTVFLIRRKSNAV